MQVAEQFLPFEQVFRIVLVTLFALATFIFDASCAPFFAPGASLPAPLSSRLASPI
jgi:hypothetical protein